MYVVPWNRGIGRGAIATPVATTSAAITATHVQSAPRGAPACFPESIVQPIGNHPRARSARGGRQI